MSKKVFIFDFDGVICDSTPECMVSAWNTWNKFHNKRENFLTDLSSFKKKEINSFKLLRPFVRGAGEYFTLMNFLDVGYPIKNISKDIYEKSVLNNEINNQKYKEIFYHQRSLLRSKNLNEWIKLHKIFKPVLKFISKLYQDNELYIATLKDKESVKIILESNDIFLKDSKILDQSQINNKLSALNFFKDLLRKKNEEIIFIDDNVSHLLEPNKKGYLVHLSTWCNCSEESKSIAKKNGIKLLNDIIQLESNYV